MDLFLLWLTVAALFGAGGAIWRFVHLRYHIHRGTPQRNAAWGAMGTGVVFALLATPLIDEPYSFFLLLACVWLACYAAFLLRKASRQHAERKKQLESAGIQSTSVLNDITSAKKLAEALKKNKAIKKDAKAKYPVRWLPGLVVGAAALTALFLAFFAMYRRGALTTNQTGYSPGTWWWLGALFGLGIVALIALWLWKVHSRGATVVGVILTAIILGGGLFFSTQYLSALANELQISPAEAQVQNEQTEDLGNATDQNTECTDANRMGDAGDIPNANMPAEEAFKASETALMFALEKAGLAEGITDPTELRGADGCLSTLGQEKYNLLIDKAAAGEIDLEAIRVDFCTRQNCPTND